MGIVAIGTQRPDGSAVSRSARPVRDRERCGHRASDALAAPWRGDGPDRALFGPLAPSFDGSASPGWSRTPTDRRAGPSIRAAAGHAARHVLGVLTRAPRVPVTVAAAAPPAPAGPRRAVPAPDDAWSRTRPTRAAGRRRTPRAAAPHRRSPVRARSS